MRPLDVVTRHRRWLIGLALLSVVLLTGHDALRWGLGSLDTLRAARIITRLVSENTADTADLVKFERAMAWLNRAEARRGPLPDQSDLRGQLLYWRAIHFAEPGPERGEGLAEAAREFRRALAQRPAWPYFWANLALAKAEAGLFDEEFDRAVRRVYETGPWEPQLQLMMIRLGFVEGSRVGPESRALMDRLMVNAVQTQPLQVMALADSPSQMAQICEVIDNPALERRCAPFLER